MPSQYPMGQALTVQVEKDIAGLHRHRPAWDQLAASAPHGEWFASPTWLLPWLEVYAYGQPLWFCFVYRDNDLVGVCPLVRLAPVGGRCAPSAGFPVNPQVRRVGVLSSLAIEDTIAAVLRSVSWDRELRCVAFQRIPKQGEFDVALERTIQGAGFRDFLREEQGSAVVRLPGGWDTYLSTLDSKKLRNLRSRRRKLDGDGQWRFRMVDRPSDLDHAWSAVLEIERGSWKHSQGSSLVSEQRAGAFYRMVAERAATSGQLRLHLLEHADAPVAYAFGVVDRGTYYLLKNSYHDAFKSWSPGMCLVWHAMTEAAATGCDTLDFLGDIHDWKREFATALPEYVTRTVYPSGNLRCHGCHVVEETIKPLARRFGITRLMGRVHGRD